MPQPVVTRGWPLEAFIGDIIVCTLEGNHLDQVTEIVVAPAAKGIVTTIGDPLSRSQAPVQHSATALTVTFEISVKTYPGEKRIVLKSPEGDSDPLPFLLMM